MFGKKLAKDFFCIFTMSNELDIKVYFLINTINTVMIIIIHKTRLSPKLVLKFDKK